MRKLLNLTIILTLFIPFSFGAENPDYFEDSYARMSYVKGDVFIQRAEDLGYEQGTVNLALIQGDKIGTREGRAEIDLGEGNFLRIDKDTQIMLAEMPDRSEDATGIHLLSGNVFLRINFMTEEKFIQVHTPDTSVYVLEEGLYYLSIRQGSQTEIRVFEGSAEAAGEDNSLLLRAEQKLIVSNGRFITNPTRFYASMNSSFAEWNSSRDAFHDRYAAGTRYLPSELSEYEAELSYYGDWRYHNSYGYVWVPSGISLSWRPYYHGRWVWYPILGWTWVSYEPWGWCVSHYGRWHWGVGIGWYWIPTRRWAPAWVHWYHGPNYIGWCPLSYYGYPGVVINNHYYGNYYHNYYPTGSRALTVVHKDQLQARNISKAALSKSQVSRLSKISMSSSQPSIKPAVKQTGIRASEAAQVFSKTQTRTITKAYSGKRAVRSSPRLGKASVSRSEGIKVRSNAVKRQSQANDNRSARTGVKRSYPSRSSGTSTLGRTLTQGKSSDVRSQSGIKTYPSRKIRGVTRSSGSSRAITRSSNSSSSRSRSADRIRRYPSRTVSRTSKSRLSSSRSVNSSTRRSVSSSRNRSISSTRSSLRKRSIPRVSSRTKSRNITSSRRISSPNLRSRSSSSSRIRSNRSRVRSSSARIRSSSSRSRSSSARVRSSSSRSRSSSSRIRSSSSRSRGSSRARSKRTSSSRSSSGSSSKKRVRKK